MRSPFLGLWENERERERERERASFALLQYIRVQSFFYVLVSAIVGFKSASTRFQRGAGEWGLQAVLLNPRSLPPLWAFFFQAILYFCSKGLDEINWQLGTTTLRACSSKLYRCRLCASRLRRLRPLIFELLLPLRRYISSSAAAATTITTTITVCRWCYYLLIQWHCSIWSAQ